MDEEIEIQPDLSVFPSVEVDVAVDPESIHLACDDSTIKSIADYKDDMLKDGLVESDFEYFLKAYKSLEEVKFIKIHCTGCDKHMGSAPNEQDNRYQHPILKVLLCIKCYQFYCSGEFEKGEDGSELYCRWCGEGGLVYCCTKCPFVFCKNCIARNLGRGTARIIENTEHWVCFSCNPWQINRHRVTYWAIQKYSEEVIENAKHSGDVSKLGVDANVCCQGKKRIEPREKTRAPAGKKPKAPKLPFDVTSILEGSLNCNIPSTSKGKKSSSSLLNDNSLWGSLPMVHSEPEDEVICTPDIIPIDESPPGSPLLSTPPPLIPYVIQQQSVSKIQPQTHQILGKGKIVPVQLKTLQKPSFQKQMFAPLTQMIANRSSPINLGVLNQQEGLRIIHHPVSQTQTINVDKANKNAENTTTETENDWFDKAIVECTEVTAYVSTKISGLAGVHSRAHKSERLMEELHNTLQTYVHVAIDKMRRIKRNMRINYDKEMNKSSQKIVNPFAKNKPLLTEDSSSQDTQSAASEDDVLKRVDDVVDTDSNSVKSKKRKRKDSIVPKQTKIQRITADDDVLFDMDVTNASDEESRTSSSIGSEAHFQTEEVINITSSSDDDSDVEEVIMTEKTNADNSPEKEILNKEGEEEESNKEGVEEESNKEEAEVSNKKDVDEKVSKKKDVDEEVSKKKDVELSNEEEVEQEENKKVEEKIPETTKLNELLEKVETKFNIKNLTSNDLLKYLSAKVILYNNRRAKKAFSKTTTTQTKFKQFHIINTIQDLLNTEWEKMPIKEKTPEPCDVEEMLGSSVIRARKSFGDEFSRFIDKSSEGENCNIPSGDELSENEEEAEAEEDISNNVDTNQNENEKMSDDSELDEAELFFNKDNESLSLPPDGIGDSIQTNNIFATKEENGDLVLDSGILALKQMAENCVNPTVELRQASTECNG